jgi:hypothetical protein
MRPLQHGITNKEQQQSSFDAFATLTVELYCNCY